MGWHKGVPPKLQGLHVVWYRVALLDYGQVKDLPDNLRLGYANLILAIDDNDPLRATQSYRELGIKTLSYCEEEPKEMLKLAKTMFDTKLPAGSKMLQPFSEDSSLKKISVQSFPEELFCVLRTVHLLRGLSVGMDIDFSCAEQWRPIAEEALHAAGRLKGQNPKGKVQKGGFIRRIFGRG
ncbi:kinase superfamily protein [Thalictrum thalictroides]|uniref:Kinase superfamily protein n=1 Tax=Thalictrum thalictroides TaxID=46969 RepID=A0A7J6UTN7_THATH|nr:kinase superfamily protein [Thalictrum thalictroides]